MLITRLVNPLSHLFCGCDFVFGMPRIDDPEPPPSYFTSDVVFLGCMYVRGMGGDGGRTVFLLVPSWENWPW